MSKELRVLIAAGGTGGHVFPAISIADALRDQSESVKIEFVGTRDKIEWIAVPNAGYPINNIWISGFHRRVTLKNISFPAKLLISIIQSYHIIRKFKPDMVVSCGGYVAGPIGWVAARKRIPLVLQEQNSFPGVTNRLLAKDAVAIFTAFKQADNYFPKGKTLLFGNPTRKSLFNVQKENAYKFFGFKSDKPTLVVMGGSGGARAVNEAMVKEIDRLHNDLQLQIIWQCGTRYATEMRKRVDHSRYPNLRLLSFIDNMANVYAVSDLIISRAGAGSCAELMLMGKPSILIPSPHVAGDHQTKNALAMVENGAAILIKDKELNIRFYTEIAGLYHHKERLEKMSNAAKKLAIPDAADKIAHKIIEIIDPKSTNNKVPVSA
jgi:UDP-N-acetylglucosamine--N-acetylmuramyl-(pentapeptide) pyrophosphoryl-undecaprenol N-acetylglucosamine transferase